MDQKVAEQAKEIVAKHLKAMGAELVEVIAFPYLEEAVKKTALPFDDVLLAALEPQLKIELAKLIQGL